MLRHLVGTDGNMNAAHDHLDPPPAKFIGDLIGPIRLDGHGCDGHQICVRMIKIDVLNFLIQIDVGVFFRRQRRHDQGCHLGHYGDRPFVEVIQQIRRPKFNFRVLVHGWIYKYDLAHAPPHFPGADAPLSSRFPPSTRPPSNLRLSGIPYVFIPLNRDSPLSYR